MKKRILALILTALTLCPMIVSCADNKPDDNAPAEDNAPTASAEVVSEEEIAEDESSVVMDDLGEADFGGAEYIIAGMASRTTTAVTAAELTGEVINDAQYNSARTVEDRFNVKVSYYDLAVDDGTMVTAIKGLVSGGDDTYAVTIARDGDAIPLALSGHFHNLTNIPQFNFDMPWWIDSTKTIGIGNKYYVASNYLTYYCLYYMRLFVVNKELLGNLGMEMPYQKVYEGNWYLEDLYKMAEAGTMDLNGDGSMTADDQYGLSYEVLYTLQESLGIQTIGKDQDNMPFVNLNVEAAEKYLSLMEPLCQNFGFYETGYGATFFSNGKSLMCYCNLREVCNVIRDTDLNYGFLPAPKLDETQEDYITCATDVYWGIPVTQTSKLEMIGYTTEALTCQHFNNVRPAFFETTMKTKLSGSDDDAKMLDIIADHLSIDFGFAWQSSIGACASLDDFINDKVMAGSVSSTMAKLTKTLDKSLQKVLENYEKLP